MSTDISLEKPALLSAEEFARLMGGLSPRTVRQWAAKRRIASCKLGSRVMIPSSEVERLVRETQRLADDQVAK